MSKALIASLQRIQSKLKAPKSQFNSFGKYHYRNCEDILEAVKPLLAEEKVSLLLTDELVENGFAQSSENREITFYESKNYIKATATITDGESSISVSALARESYDKKGMDSAQITGATSSYARKYALNGLFLIDDTRDPDSTNDHGKTSKPEAKTKKSATSTKNSFKPKTQTEDTW